MAVAAQRHSSGTISAPRVVAIRALLHRVLGRAVEGEAGAALRVAWCGRRRPGPCNRPGARGMRCRTWCASAPRAQDGHQTRPGVGTWRAPPSMRRGAGVERGRAHTYLLVNPIELISMSMAVRVMA
jgi:hypothetical protein